MGKDNDILATAIGYLKSAGYFKVFFYHSDRCPLWNLAIYCSEIRPMEFSIPISIPKAEFNRGNIKI